MKPKQPGQKLTQYAPKPGSHSVKPINHGGSQPIKQAPGVHHSLGKPFGKAG
jgi:hypothetical protein